MNINKKILFGLSNFKNVGPNEVVFIEENKEMSLGLGSFVKANAVIMGSILYFMVKLPQNMHYELYIIDLDEFFTKHTLNTVKKQELVLSHISSLTNYLRFKYFKNK